MKIKGFFKDVSGASKVTKRREELFLESDNKIQKDPIMDCAKKLHPGKLQVTVSEIEEVSPTAKRFTFKPVDGFLPIFLAGWYLVLDLKIGKTVTSRPYSICSAPYQTQGKDPFVQITVRKGRDDGFASNYIYENIKKGDKLFITMPFGHFNYDSLRDSTNIIGIAGGSGITPFVSMAKEITNKSLDVNLTILYGSVHQTDIIMKDDLEKLNSKNVKVINVISGDADYKGEKGFINKDIIKKYSKGDCSYFVCGPLPMYQFVLKELQALAIPERRIRTEVFGAPRDISKCEDYPNEFKDKEFSIKVIRGIKEDVIPAKANEPVVVALERACLKLETHCRSGECGFCHCKLLEGNIYVPKQGDGRRASDKEFNYFHACSTYPLSDLTIKIPIE